jgi:hypothetical protein
MKIEVWHGTARKQPVALRVYTGWTHYPTPFDPRLLWRTIIRRKKLCAAMERSQGALANEGDILCHSISCWWGSILNLLHQHPIQYLPEVKSWKVFLGKPCPTLGSIHMINISDRHGTGSPGQWVFWVISVVRVTGSSSWPGVRPGFFQLSIFEKCLKRKTYSRCPQLKSVLISAPIPS